MNDSLNSVPGGELVSEVVEDVMPPSGHNEVDAAAGQMAAKCLP